MSTDRYRVLISAPYFLPEVERYRSFFQERGIIPVIADVNERLEESDLLKVIEDIDGVICGDDRFTPSVFAKAKKLKVVAKWGTGIDSIDREAAKKVGVQVLNTPNAFTEPVSDTVLGYMLNFARNLAQMATEMRGGRWEKIKGRTLAECTLGIIGFGNIGTAVARKARPFGVRVLAYDVAEIPQSRADEVGVRLVSLDTVLAESDFVSVNCDLNPTSHHLINRETLARMKSTACLINTARGPIVDEQALIDALTAKKLAGAGLDVFEHEPLPKDSPLLKLPNVFCAPHNSNSSPKAWQRIHESTLKNLLQGLGYDA